MRLQITFLLLFSLGICKIAHSQDSLQLVFQADSLASEAWKIYQSNPKAAILSFEQSKALFAQIKSWNRYFEISNGVSLSQYYQFRKTGDGKDYFDYTTKTAHEIGQHPQKDDKNYALALLNLGLAYKEYKGDLQAALEHYNQGLQIMNQLASDTLDIANGYYNVGGIYKTTGDYDQAIQYVQKAKELFITYTNNQPSPQDQRARDLLIYLKKKTAKTFLTIGHYHRFKEDYSAALQHYYTYLSRVSPDIQNSQTTNLIYCYHSMSRIYADQAQFDSADIYLQKAFKFHEEGVTKRVIQSYENRGYYHSLKSEFDQALEAYQQANTLAQQRYKKPKYHVKSRTLSQIADTYLQLKDYASALEYYQKAMITLAIDFEDQAIDKNPEIKQFLSLPQALDLIAAKGKTLQQRFLETGQKKDLLLARENDQFAAQIINAQRRNFLADGSKHTLAAKALAVYEGAIETTLQLYQLTNQPQYLEEAFSYAERNKSLLLLESMQENVAKVAGQLSQDDLLKEKELNSEIAFLEKQIMDQKSKGEQRNLEKIKQWESKLFDARLQYQELVASFEKKYPDYYQLKHQIQPSSVAQLREQLLDNKTALFEYFVGNDHIYAFCITAENMKVEKIKRTETLSNSLDQLTALISQPPFKQDLQQVFADFSASNWMLSEQLTQPLIASLSPAVKRLIIIPDDQLAYLPFELLLTEKPAANNTSFSPKQFAYLIKQYAISYNYSATLLLNHLKQKRSRRLKPLIGFAPSFSNGPIAASRECFDGEVYSLQCNGEEVKAINEIFNGQQQLGKQANLATFKKMAKDYRIIHLATHACAGESDALNKIYFADGYLTNFDLPNLELNAELAVLSACNTGSGQLVKGEGVMSLSRGFTLANCPSTLMSLWTVDDCITSDLMLRFYEKLKAGQSKDEALQQTKIEHLEATDKAGMHPYYWAAFLQSGNAAPIDFSTHWNYWWGLLVLLLLFLFLFFQRKRNLSIKI